MRAISTIARTPRGVSKIQWVLVEDCSVLLAGPAPTGGNAGPFRSVQTGYLLYLAST
jgi:hypothetical protein